MKRRSTVARHAKLKQQSFAAQFFTVLTTAVITVLVAGLGVAAFYTWSLFDDYAKDAVALSDAPAAAPSISEYPGAFSMLIVGTDECDASDPRLVAIVGEERCLDPDANGKLNDVNILVHVSAAPRKLTAVIIPRDTIIDTPECTREDGTIRPASYEPINNIYPDGGLGCVVDAVSELSGLSIPFAVKVSFANVVALADAVGGVNVCIAGDGLYDPHTGLSLDPGMHELTGGEALQFLRTRYGVGDGSDLSRGGNQRQYLSRLLQKVSSPEVLGSIPTLLNLGTVVAKNVTPSASLADPIALVQLALSIRDVKMSDATFVGLPVGDAGDGKVMPLYDDAQVLWEALANGDSLQLSGDLSINEGVVEAGPDGTAPTEAPDLDGDGYPDEEPAPEEPEVEATVPPGTVVLPDTITGNKADQNTCSNGRG